MNKGKTILILVALLLLMTAAGELLSWGVFAEYTGKAHLAVPLFFLLLYAVPVAVVAQPTDAKQFIQQLLIFKSVKMVVSIGALLGLCLLVKEQATAVLVSFLIYSLVMIVAENVYVFNIKKKISKSA